MIRKFFPLDKNYLLEEAQLRSQDQLLTLLIERVKDAYFDRYNPLRLNDSVSESVARYRAGNIGMLKNFYHNLAGVYRYRFGDNQLEFLWDGTDHHKKYKEEWVAFFQRHIALFCRQELFLRAVLDLTVFRPQNDRAHLAENRMNNFMLQHFEMRLIRQRGMLETKVA